MRIAAIVVILGTGVFLFMFIRPDLVSVDSFRATFTTLMNYMPGRKAGETPGGSGRMAGRGGAGDQVAEKKEIYLIELKTGGRVYTDNLKTGDGKLTYETASGLVITINSHEVLGVRTFKEGEEPDK